jgi:hypothetical protein
MNILLSSSLVCITLLFGSGCAVGSAKENNMVCNSKTSIELSRAISAGMSREDSVALLETRKVEYWFESEEDKKTRKRGRSSDPEFVSAEFLLTAAIENGSSGLIRFQEFLKVGFDKDNKVERVACKTVYTGP